MTTIAVPVSRTDVFAGNLNAFDVIVLAATAQIRESGQVVPCTLAFAGFEKERRKPFEIPEFRAWCKAGDDAATALVACALDQASLTLYLCSILDVDVTRDAGRTIIRIRSAEQVDLFVRRAMESIIACCDGEGRRYDAALLCDQTLERIAAAVGVDPAESGIGHRARHVAISREAVIERNTDDVVALLRAALKECQLAGTITPWALTLSGFEDDPRDLFEIPEVRTWCGTVHDKCSAFVACALDATSLTWYLCSLVSIDVIRTAGGKTRVRVKSNDQVEHYARQAADKAARYCAQLKRPHEDAVDLALTTIDRIAEAVSIDLSGLTP